MHIIAPRWEFPQIAPGENLRTYQIESKELSNIVGRVSCLNIIQLVAFRVLIAVKLEEKVMVLIQEVFFFFSAGIGNQLGQRDYLLVFL